MSTVQACCTTCNQTWNYTPYDVTTLKLYVPTSPELFFYQYRFICRNCRAIVIKPCQYQTHQVLVGAGCREEVIAPVYDVIPLNAPLITLDDIIDFHKELKDL